MPKFSAIPLSTARRAGELLYLSGQLGFVASGALAPGGIVPQTRQTIDNIRRALEKEGAALGDVVKMTVWLKNCDDFGAFNEVYADALRAPYPARSTVICDLAIEGALVEIEAIAHLK